MLLDEAGDIPANLQVKLLRAIEHREVTPVGDARPRPTDIRVIAATNRPLADLMASGQFREDLFFRLSVFQIHIPPLRERPEDIPALAEHFLRSACLPRPPRPTCRRACWRNSPRGPGWATPASCGTPSSTPRSSPGAGRSAPSTSPPPRRPSHRRRRRRRPRARGRGRRLGPAGVLPGTAASRSCYERFLELVEPPLLRAVLDRCRGNRVAAAQLLGIHRATLRQKLRRYEID